MKLTYNDKTLVGISISDKFEWNKDTISALEIDWQYLQQKYTEFQIKVWKELVKISWGETRTYKQVATSIGKPNACRAVAGACATNPLALIIPCHRVTGTKNIGGYYWGTIMKEYLLDSESEANKSQTGKKLKK